MIAAKCKKNFFGWSYYELILLAGSFVLIVVTFVQYWNVNGM